MRYHFSQLLCIKFWKFIFNRIFLITNKIMASDKHNSTTDKASDLISSLDSILHPKTCLFANHNSSSACIMVLSELTFFSFVLLCTSLLFHYSTKVKPSMIHTHPNYLLWPDLQNLDIIVHFNNRLFHIFRNGWIDGRDTFHAVLHLSCSVMGWKWVNMKHTG